MFRVTLQLFVLIIFSSNLYCQLYWKSEEKFEKDIIIVQGEAIKEVPADFATFDFGVRGTAKSLELAVKEAREKIALITDQLYQIGLEPSNLATTHFRSGENYKDKAFLSSKRDYVAEIKVLVGMDSLQLLEPAIVAVSSSNPESMSDITFDLKNIEAFKISTVAHAVKKAREKANSICEELELGLGNAVYIEELIGDNVNYQSTNSVVLLERSRPSNTFKSIYAETVRVKARMRVVFKVRSQEQD